MGRSEVVPGRPDTKRHRFCYLAVCGQCLFRLVRLLHPLLGVLTGTPPPARGRELGGSRVFPTGRRGLAPRGGAAATPTGLWAEAILLVAVVVLRGAAPAVAVRAALGGAAVVAGALETERELAGLSVRVAT